MLQEETDKGDANPAAGTEENRLTAFLDEVHKVCVEPNGSHGFKHRTRSGRNGKGR